MSTHLAALRSERRTVLDFCRDLTEADWAAPSRAPGWSVKDVVGHLGGEMKALVTPAMVGALLTSDIERYNDREVAKGRDRAANEVLEDFEKWSTRAISALGVLTGPVVNRTRLRIGELGWFPLRVAPAIFVFDWHTHLRHDVAPAIGKPPPPTDEQRMPPIVTWLMMLLEQSQRDRLDWLDASIALRLNGLGGGTWKISPVDGKLRVGPGTEAGTTAQITASSVEFPVWGTTRTPWRECDVEIAGDTTTAERFLDAVNLV